MARSSEKERLTQLIQQWNVDHYDLFEICAPNQDLEFHGVVRFYFQGGDGANVITKCIRVSSTATTQDVIDTLIEKFRPDMRMLTQNKYALYEVHVNGEERRLGDLEKPLWVQLNWGKDVREGRFLLKNENEKTVRDPALGFKEPAKDENPNFKRKLSKREKKEKKKRDQEIAKQNESVSSKLYTEAPETSFTRSISNPEAVMRRRRQQKLEKKLAQMQSREGGPDSGGTLKIYGESLQPDVPYKTLLLSTADTTNAVIKEAMEKYGLEKEDPEQFCLMEVLLPPGSQEYHGGSLGQERVLDEGECPLAIVMQHPKQKGHIIFQLRRMSANDKRRTKRTRAVSHDDLRKAHDQPATQADKLPYLIELHPRDGRPKRHLLPLNVTEVVRDRPMTPGNQFLQLSGPDIHPRHCVIAHTEGIVTVTPTSRDADIFVENHRVNETTMLRHGMTIQFGRNHVYKFMDPRFEELTKQGQPVPAPRNVAPQETNFDVDGHVETVTQRHGPPNAQPRPQSREMQQARMAPNMQPATNGHEPQLDQLPASLEYRLDAEDRLLQAVILEVNSRAVQFKLAPTYTLYMAIRRLLVSRSQMPPPQHARMVSDFVSKTSKLIQQAIQEHHNDPTALAFWMANASEVLHFFKQDVEVQPYSADSQELLAEAVQMAFHHLVRCLQGDLQRVMPAFLDPSDAVDDENLPPEQYNQNQPLLADVLNTLSAAMTLLRRCRVNAALTIQLFSQLFHFINMWLFNILVMEPQLQLCTRAWGLRLKRRLGRIEAWAEKQGLELAADCHLCRIIQAAHLLQAPKVSSDDITNISSTCFKLNSMQLRVLLTRYITVSPETAISPAFIERVVVIAENMADELTRTDGREVRLEEDPDLHLPFLLPEDGYSCDTIRGIPNGLPEFVSQLGNTGICAMVANPNASGSWTVYMQGGGQQTPAEPPRSPKSNQPEILTVSFKKVKGSMGLSIVAAVGEGLAERGIYIKSVVPGGAAALDGRLKAGDQLLEVDGRSLVGLSQDKAAELMTQTGDVVTLKVAKQGAFYHGLATLLNEPSPTVQRHPVKGGPMGRGEEAPPPYMGPPQDSPNDLNRSRPVPQPRGQNPNARGSDNLDRLRSPSAGNLSQQQQQYQPPQPPEPSNYNRQGIDPRSKSTSNLHVDTSFERNDPHANMRGAASVSMLHPGVSGYPQYSPAGRRPDIRPNDYENQPQVSPGSGHGSYNQDINQNVKPGGLGPNPQLHPPGHRPSDRSSVSSRASSNSNRDMRPQSAYYDTQQQPPRDDYNYAARPKSEDVTAHKLREWQDKYDPHGQGYRGNDPNHSPQYANQNPGYRGTDNGPHSPPYINHNQVFPPGSQGPGFSGQGPPPNAYGAQNQGPRANEATTNDSPPYTNIGSVANSRPQQQTQPEQPRLSARDRLFGNQGAPQKAPQQTNQQRQPNFYENTQAASQEPAPPFHQLHRPPSESDGKPKPAIMPKPAVAKKPGPKVQPAEVPFKTVDNRQTQPGFYGNADRQQAHQVERPDPRMGQPDPRTTLQGQDPRFMQQDPRAVQQDTRTMQPDPRSMQQDPRSMQQDPRGMQQDPRAMQQPDPRGGYSMQKFPSVRGDPGPYGYPATQPGLARDNPPDLPPPPEDNEELPPLPPPPQDFYDQQLQEEQQRLMESMTGQPTPPPSNLATTYDRYGQPVPGGYSAPGKDQQNQAPNYQNINFVSEVRAGAGPAGQVPLTTPPDFHEPYSSRNNPPQQQQHPPPPSQTFTTKPTSLYQPHQQLGPPQPQQLPPPSSPLQANPPLTPSGLNKNSAWDRAEKEKAEEQQAEDLYRAREREIVDLESRSYLSIPDQERLRKLKLEHEFQRRVKEVDEKGDYDADDDDEEMMERLFTRERLITSLKDDLEKSRQRIGDLDHRQAIQDAQKEKERMQRLERRLEMMEKDRQEMHERMEKRQQRRSKDHQEQLRLQREAREKQRQNYEEQKRLLMMEEEKMRQRREEEVNKRRQMERERLQEMQMARDTEELRLRAEARRQNDDYVTQQMLQQRQQRIDQNREIRVSDERRRLESLSSSQQPTGNGGPVGGPGGHLNNGVGRAKNNAGQGQGYQQYMNLPPPTEKENLAPPPPERKSSYNTAAATRNNLDYTSLSFHQQQDLPPPPPPPPQQQQQQQQGQGPGGKKSVSFNTDMNTYQDRTPSQSFSSEHNLSPPADHVPHGANDVFNTPPQDASRPATSYVRSENTPAVIGSQEVYRDPRSRIEAQKAASGVRKPAVERMSFRDKMKYFAQEAGEDAPKYKPKASKTLRNIESQLNGQ
ncbi:afadin-like isoform X2 [Littorina saxatilis]|uniref:Afadin n=1 Tax=Littorina saxatilis TaxID=31220 RepID=A0AAN9GGZ2_9CAEN